MFIDTANVHIKAGDGGNGALSFRHEKFIDRGGPDGGDGGHGADVVFVASRNQNTLANFRFKKLIKAEDGQAGSKRRKHGKKGEILLVPVPVGTTVIMADGSVLADLTEDQQTAVIAKGGNGGFGNAHFVSSTRQAPRLAEKGEPGEELDATLELKMIADVGLVGLPNAGKSTLLSIVSNAHPEIANYPFTTLTPNLGVVDVDKDHSLLMADIPGLIEGASEGKGLGDDFLRHVERTLVLVHLIDAYNENPAEAYKTIQAELKAYRVDLSTRPEVVVLTKVEGLDQDIIDDHLKTLKKVVPKGTPLFAISAPSKQGVKELLYAVVDVVDKERTRLSLEEPEEEKLPVIRLEDQDSWTLTITDEQVVVTGRKIERFAHRTDFQSFHAVQRMRDIMRKMGIMHELKRKGVEPGTKVKIGDPAIGSIEY